MSLSHIRNFCIIAHIDHGKSTLADRILESTGAVAERDRKEQLLDSMDLERERGITIKASAARMYYKAADGKTYEFNLIDTPGHVDFSYEVSRSLNACEGALLVVDAVQGVQAQTLANVYLAIDHNLEVIPVLNKIDLPAADPARVIAEIEEDIGMPASDAVRVSAKTGAGIPELLEAIVQRIPPPKGGAGAPLQALIFDSWFDNYRGVVAMIRVKEGTLRLGDRVLLMSTGAVYEVTEMGVFAPVPTLVKELACGEVGFFSANIRTVRECRIGDTVTHADHRAAGPLPGFKEAKPMVFAGLFPTEPSGYPALREALEKLRLNDSSLVFEPETSKALGFGFRVGFLGLLHMEIVQERLEREFDADLITTAPTVVYKVIKTNGETVNVDNPANLPPAGEIEDFHEPMVRVSIHVPAEYIGAIMKLCESRRGSQRDLAYHGNRVVLVYELPLAEMVYDFYDKLKSLSRGYASLDYELSGYQPAKLVKLDVLLNGDPVDALSCIVHRDHAYHRGKALVSKMQGLIPRQQFEVAIQAAIGTKVIARETVKALRKNVTAKCYGGDITRKRKLLEKQKEGKKRMKQVGAVEVPQEAFLAVLAVDED